MPVYAVWESHFPLEAAAEGRAATEAIWRDMLAFDGYVSHALIEDLDDPGHLLVLGQWASRAHADDAVRRYAGHPNVARVNELLATPRTRFVGQALAAAA